MFTIVISIVKSKFIAVLLGPAGIGISGLLTSTTGMITGFTNFGLGVSAVKNVAEAHAHQNGERINTVVAVLRRLVWLTGLLGTFVTLLLAPWLSEWTFGNRDYSYAFMFLSVTLLFTQLSAGQNVILQGTRNLKYLAKANVLGSLLGLIITVPLYFVLGIKGIVPAIIISSVIALLLSWHFSRKIPVGKVQLSFRDVQKEGKEMLTMGFMLSMGSLVSLIVAYFIRIYIGGEGGVEEVGFYNAGFIITETYVGLILSSMGSDYYPRLSGVAHDNGLAKETINRQAEMATLILAPVIIFFFVCIQWIIQLLYSSKFNPINGMIQWMAMGMFFRATSWSIGFLFLAKGASTTYFITQLLGNIGMISLSIIGYKYAGLDGLGMGFMVNNAIFLLIVFIVCNRKYQFKFNRDFVKIFLPQLCCAIACLCAMKLLETPYQYLAGSGLIGLSAVYSVRELDRKMDLNKIILNIKRTMLNDKLK
jgi:O-antigen/teichoic acid export membrane protein